MSKWVWGLVKVTLTVGFVVGAVAMTLTAPTAATMGTAERFAEGYREGVAAAESQAEGSPLSPGWDLAAGFAAVILGLVGLALLVAANYWFWCRSRFRIGRRAAVKALDRAEMESDLLDRPVSEWIAEAEAEAVREWEGAGRDLRAIAAAHRAHLGGMR